MNKLLTNLILGFAATGFFTASPAMSDDAKALYYATADKAAADYRDAHAACETLETHLQPICIEEAKLAQTRAKGNAEAQYRNTAQARQKADIDIANAEFSVAKARCEIRDSNEKSACLRQALALKIAAVEAAKSGHKKVASGTR